MPKFRKKPVVVNAVQWTGINVEEMHGWLSALAAAKTVSEEVAQQVQFDMTKPPHIKLSIKTLEGEMAADHGDFVICGVKGELYPCKPDIFEATYEAVEE